MGITSKRKKCGYAPDYLYKVPGGLNTGTDWETAEKFVYRLFIKRAFTVRAAIFWVALSVFLGYDDIRLKKQIPIYI